MKRGYLSEAFVSFQGEGLHVGRRQLFLRFAGCPLRCRYCDTPGSLVRTKDFVVHADPSRVYPNPVSIEEVAGAVDLLGADGVAFDGVSLTGGEPLAQSAFLATLLRSGRLPRPRLLETSGTLSDELAEVVDELDVVSMDIKLPSNTGERSFWEEHRRFLEGCDGKAYVKILVDSSTSNRELARAAALVRDASPASPVFLQPITPRKGDALLSFKGVSSFFAVAREHVEDVRVVPQTHKMLDYR